MSTRADLAGLRLAQAMPRRTSATTKSKGEKKKVGGKPKARTRTEPLNQVKEDILFDHPDTNPSLLVLSGRTAADPLLSVVSALERRRSLNAHCVHYTTHSNIYARQKTHLQLTTHTASLASPHLHLSFTHLSLPSFTLSPCSPRHFSLIRSPLNLSGVLFQPNERATFDQGCCSFSFDRLNCQPPHHIHIHVHMSSQLPTNAMLALQQLLGALASSDNTSRARAEESLNNEWIAARPDMLLSGLAERARVADDPVVSFPLPLLQFQTPPVSSTAPSAIPEMAFICFYRATHHPHLISSIISFHQICENLI